MGDSHTSLNLRDVASSPCFVSFLQALCDPPNAEIVLSPSSRWSCEALPLGLWGDLTEGNRPSVQHLFLPGQWPLRAWTACSTYPWIPYFTMPNPQLNPHSMTLWKKNQIKSKPFGRFTMVQRSALDSLKRPPNGMSIGRRNSPFQLSEISVTGLNNSISQSFCFNPKLTQLAAPWAWISEELKNTTILGVQYFSTLNLSVEKNWRIN